jgi:hypothetical protein
MTLFRPDGGLSCQRKCTIAERDGLAQDRDHAFFGPGLRWHLARNFSGPVSAKPSGSANRRRPSGKPAYATSGAVTHSSLEDVVLPGQVASGPSTPIRRTLRQIRPTMSLPTVPANTACACPGAYRGRTGRRDRDQGFHLVDIHVGREVRLRGVVRSCVLVGGHQRTPESGASSCSTQTAGKFCPICGQVS